MRRNLRLVIALPIALGALQSDRTSAVAQERNPPAEGKALPKGSDRAVKAALAAWPQAVLEDVVTPSDSIGLGGDDDSIWSLHLKDGGARRSVSISSDGVPIRSSMELEAKDLPSTVAKGMAKVAPDGASKITKLETLAVVRYVALPTPKLRYGVRVRNAGGASSVTVAPDGTIVETKPAKEPKKPRAADPNARTQDGPVPELAAKAVKAMREVFPDMVFDLVEEVPYIDSSTQTIVMLWYEVEFFVGGVKHEFNATPDGIVIDFWKTIGAAELPGDVAAAVAKAFPDGKIEEVTRSETRAHMRFVALGDPIVVYEVHPHGEADAEADGIKLRVDGTVVDEPELPDWAKKPAKKGKKAGV